MEERKEDLQEEMTVENTEETLSDEAANTEAETDNAVNAEEENAEAAAEEAEQAEDTDSEEVQDGPGDKADKKFFKKKAKTDKKQDALKEKVDELEDKVKRQMAEFDNFRKRTEKEKAMMFETGAKSVIEKILPVVDNFERGLATIPEEDKGSGFANGMEMIYRQLMTELEKMDVKPIPAVGEEFNPEFHNAVMQVESEEYESGVVAQELLKGYTYRDTVVRHSMVTVVS
ncbi:MAG: nucleotide exchange factor GrpE [Lachnospiraceae bacterium]|nr:nucleotide exchange factor GrpE [Lachnospiraceae bacterium]